jgi:outer membrane biosynthesis protein TonB
MRCGSRGVPGLKRQRELEQKNMNEVFCDGVSHVILSRGLVSIEFFHLVYQGEDGPHKPVPFLSLTIPVNGFLKTFDTGEQIVEHMIQVGMISKDAAPVALNPASAKKSEKKNAKSQPAPAKKAAPAPAAKKSAPAPAKKAEAKPAPAPAKKATPAPAAKKPAPAPAKKAEAKPAPVPAKKSAPAPAKKSAPAPAKKSAPAPAKKSAKGKNSAK